MKITKILKPNQNQPNFIIEFDNQNSIQIPPDEIGTYDVGSELTDTEYTNLLKSTIKKVLFQDVYNYLSYKKRTESEIRTYIQNNIKKKHLKSDTFDQQISKVIENEIVERLIDLKYINDIDYIQSYLNYNNNKNSPYGINKIIMELNKKGISYELNDYIDSEQEEINASKVVLKKYSSSSKFKDDYQSRGKLLNYLTNRGYTYNTSKRAVDSLFASN